MCQFCSENNHHLVCSGKEKTEIGGSRKAVRLRAEEADQVRKHFCSVCSPEHFFSYLGDSGLPEACCRGHTSQGFWLRGDWTSTTRQNTHGTSSFPCTQKLMHGVTVSQAPEQNISCTRSLTVALWQVTIALWHCGIVALAKVQGSRSSSRCLGCVFSL